jgi:PPM family protein phosphatase
MSEPELTPERDFAGRQCLGKRSEQEDSYAFSEILAGDGAANGLLIVLADGMGGHSAGHEASDLAVRAFVSAFHHRSSRLPARLAAALDAANNAISDAIKESPESLEGMGTTLVAVAATPAGLAWISVGDSPLYLHRKGRLQRINDDHSFRPVLVEMVEKGEITQEQATHSSLRNRLRAALTGEEIALVSASEKPLYLLEGDLILAASDGLQTLDDEAIAKIIEGARDADAAQTATHLLEAVLGAARPKQDNATVAIFKPPSAWLLPSPSPETDDPEETRRVIPREKTSPIPAAKDNPPP